jgi:membrane-anchored protein YejM (alkaline phosphatase superfamily)
LRTKRNASGIDFCYKPNFPGRVFKVAILKFIRSVAVAAVAAVANHAGVVLSSMPSVVCVCATPCTSSSSGRELLIESKSQQFIFNFNTQNIDYKKKSQF